MLEFSTMKAFSETIGQETPSETCETAKTELLSNSLIIIRFYLKCVQTLIDFDLSFSIVVY